MDRRAADRTKRAEITSLEVESKEEGAFSDTFLLSLAQLRLFIVSPRISDGQIEQQPITQRQPYRRPKPTTKTTKLAAKKLFVGFPIMSK